MEEEFDIDELKDLYDTYVQAIKDVHKKREYNERHFDPDETDSELLDSEIFLNESKSNLIEYVSKHESKVRNLRTVYSKYIMEMYDEE